MNSRPTASRRRRSGYAAILLAACAVGLLASSPARPQEEPRETVSRRGDLISIFGGRITVPAGVRQRGMVVGIGSDVVVEGEVSQDVVVILGTLKLSGTVDGTVTAILSDQQVRDARVDDQYVTVFGSVEMERTSIGDEFIHILGPLEQDAFSTRPVVNVGHWLPGFWTFLLWTRILRLLVVFVLLLMLVALIPERVRLIADEAPVRYVPAVFMGLLGYLGFWVLLVLISATVIGLPVALIAFYGLKWLGIAGIFLGIGRRLGRSFGREMSLLGAVLLTFGIYALITAAPTPLGLVGLLLSGLWRMVFFIFVEAPALGLVLLTRIGTKKRDEDTTGLPAVPAPVPTGPPIPQAHQGPPRPTEGPAEDPRGPVG